QRSRFRCQFLPRVQRGRGERWRRNLGKHRTRVALLGFGTVGSAVARRLTSRETLDNPSHEQIALTHIFDRRAEEKRRQHPSTAVVWTSRVEDVLQSDADIVIEAVGGI